MQQQFEFPYQLMGPRIVIAAYIGGGVVWISTLCLMVVFS